MTKIRLHHVLVGSVVILAAASCGSRKQYGRDNPPANPGRENAALVSPIPLDPPTEATADTSVAEVSSSFSPSDVQRLINDWHKAPVVWNKSAGDIELGTTDYTTWVNRFVEMQKAANFQTGIFPNSANSRNVQGVPVPTTVKELLITRVYEGEISLPTEKGEMQAIRMGESFVLKGFFKASADLKDIENEANATRGKTFFKNLYNTFVKGDEGGADFDCFAEKICKYQKERDYFILKYESPRKETGEIWISAKNNILVQALFAKPEFKFVNELSAPEATFDLVEGKFLNANMAVLGVGSSYAEFKAIEADEAAWLPAARINFQDFVGISLGFRKDAAERLDDLNYTVAEASDPLTEIDFDKNYLHQEKRQRALKIGSETFNFFRKDRVGLSKKELLAELQTVKVKLNKAIKDSSGEILESYIANRFDTRKFTIRDGERTNATYSLVTFFKLNSSIREVVISNRLEEPAVFVSYSTQSAAEESLNFLKKLPQSAPNSSDLNVAFGEFAIDRPIVLSELDNVRNEANLNFSNGEKYKISFNPYETFYKKLINANGVISTEDLTVSSFYINNLAVYFRRSSTCGPEPLVSPDQYCVVGITAFSFADRNSVASYATVDAARAGDLRGQLQVCGKTLKYGMTRAAFQAAFVDQENCPVASLESQANNLDKLVYYLPKANLAVYFTGDNNNTLSSFTFY